MSGSCTNVISSAKPSPKFRCTYTPEELSEKNGSSEPLSGLSGSHSMTYHDCSSRDSTGSSTISSMEGPFGLQDDSATDKRDDHKQGNLAGIIASMRVQHIVGPGLNMHEPAELAKCIRQSYPDESMTGSDLDRIVSAIEEKMTTEYLRLENGRLAWEEAVTNTVDMVQKHMELYELELRDERLRVSDASLIVGGKDGTGDQNKNSGLDNAARYKLDNPCDYVKKPVVEPPSAEWIETVMQLLAKLKGFSANANSKKWFIFDNTVFLIEAAVSHSAEYSGRLYRIAAQSKKIVQGHVRYLGSLKMKLRTAKLARLGQLNPLGVIEFVEALFEQIEGYSDHLDKIVSTADLRAQKWKAALACSTSLRDTFLGILQHPFFERVPENVMKEFADIPTIAVRTAGKLVELAATEAELPEHIFTGFYGRPSSAFLLIKPPFIGLTGEVFLTGLSQYLGIDFVLDYGCRRSD